jgi:hypothetical protein
MGPNDHEISVTMPRLNGIQNRREIGPRGEVMEKSEPAKAKPEVAKPPENDPPGDKPISRFSTKT